MDNRNLPLDLLPPIIEYLRDDIFTLMDVSLASRALRVEGQRHIFRKATQLQETYDHISFLTAITSSTMLGPFVHEYEQLDLLDAEYRFEPLWGLTCRALQLMVNLKVLVFRSIYGRPSAPILHGCTFQLTELKWGNDDDAEHLYDFLSTQTKLRTLKLEWREKSPELDTTAICPNLRVLHGNHRTINAFLPGRKVFALKWSPDPNEYRLDAPIPHLSEELQRIRYLSLGGVLGDRPPLSLVVPHLRALEVLELFDLDDAEELELLSELPKLRAFILSSRFAGDGEDLSAPELRSEYFSQVFEECNALRYIDYNYEGRTYERWFRGTGGAYPGYSQIEVDDVFSSWWNIS